jgi:hypothetical protein
MTQTTKPLIPSSEMTLYQRQRCGQRFRDQTIKGLNALIKGTGWKRNSAWVFKVEGDWYLTAFVTGGTTPDGLSNLLRVSLGIKPMAVDPINWRATGLHENLKKPLSFRSNAAFKVPALPIADRQWSEGLTDVAESSRIVFKAIIEMAEQARLTVETKPFSQLVSEHKFSKKYEALRWASLISEGHGARAIEAIKKHYAEDGSADTLSDQVIKIVASYQEVIAGTDTPHNRCLCTDIDGNQILDSPVLHPPKSIDSTHSSLFARLKEALWHTRK